MYDASENIPTASEIVDAITALRDRRDALLEERDDLANKLLDALDERDELRDQLEELRGETLVVYRMPLPDGRRWSFHPDLMVLAVAPEVDQITEMRLRVQAEPPALLSCDVCGAPLYEGETCGMHS